MKVIIEESIWDIETKQPIRKTTLTCDNEKITRNIFILGDSDRRNNKIDVIEDLRVSLADINNLTAVELGEKLKGILSDCFESNVQGEIPWFTYPIIQRLP
jgi:hypothetical protein